MSLQEDRRTAITDTLEDIKRIASARGIDRASLEEIAARLKRLATRPELFPDADFPPPPTGDVDASTRYLLHKEADDTFALYLNSINPGKNSAPHNHSTWAVIVAVEGAELNRLYDRLDDRTDPERAVLTVSREVLVSPGGDHVAFLGDDIHSIHVTGERSTRHFHLYGLALNRLTERLGFDLENNRVLNYNKNYHSTRNDRTAA